MIATIAEKKKKFSDRGDHMKIIFIFMIAMIASIAEPFFSQRSQVSQRAYGNQALMCYDPGALGSMIPIRIIPKERTHNIPVKEIYSLLPKNIFKRD